MNLEDLKNINVEDIIEFRDHGSMKNVPEEMVHYLQEMERVRGMHLRFDSRDKIINHLMKFDDYSHYLAAKLYDDSMEYFYCDRAISKSAWRNIIAEKMDKGISLAFALAKDANDVIKAVKTLKDLRDVLELDKEDTTIPLEVYQKPVKIYTTSAADLGLPEADRYELGRFIDELPELTEAERDKIKRDAQLLPFKIFKDAKVR